MAVLTTSAFGQAVDRDGRAFTYDGTTATNGSVTYILDKDVFSPASGSSTSLNNAITGASLTGAAFGVKSVINVRSYVFVSGNFAATIEARGAGSDTLSAVAADSGTTLDADGFMLNDIEVRTNRLLSFATSGFSALTDGTNTVGSIRYKIDLYRHTDSAGSLEATPLATTGDQSVTDKGYADANFNAKSVALASLTGGNGLGNGNTKGKLTLRLRRKVSLNQFAQGGQSYTANGVVTLTVN